MVNASGAVGDASLATAEKGEAALDHGAHAFVDLLRDVERFELPEGKSLGTWSFARPEGVRLDQFEGRKHHYQLSADGMSQAIGTVTNTTEQPTFVFTGDSLGCTLTNTPNGPVKPRLLGYLAEGKGGAVPELVDRYENLGLDTLTDYHSPGKMGEFANAIRTARSAIQLARMHGEDSLMTDLDQQIALYQLGMPYRDTPK